MEGHQLVSFFAYLERLACALETMAGEAEAQTTYLAAQVEYLKRIAEAVEDKTYGSHE